MDQQKVGRFIALKRKEKNLTQEQLAEYLGITNKAVSKWECGKNLPDASLMKPLSEILGIEVSELLTGESSNGSHPEKSERLIIDLSKVIEGLKRKRRITLCVVLGLVLMNVGDRLPELLMLDRELLQSQFLAGMLDGMSWSLLIVGFGFFASGTVLFIKERRERT